MINIVSSEDKISSWLLSEYSNSFIKKLKNIDLETFIRIFTANFFLTGESQQITRVLDKITQIYFAAQDPSNFLFKKSDDVYVFANAIIILNTDQHNPKN